MYLVGKRVVVTDFHKCRSFGVFLLAHEDRIESPISAENKDSCSEICKLKGSKLTFTD